MNEQLKGLHALIEEGVRLGVYPGATYSLIVNQEVHLGVVGSRAIIPTEEINQLDTIYDMASCSKVLSTTTAILQLLEQGKLRLYDSVTTYLPMFTHKDITIYDLLTHTSGLPAMVPKSNTISSKEECIQLVYEANTIYPKNSKIVYSDVGFILLGWIVEAISGKTLDNYSTENIFFPLGMIDTGYNPTEISRVAPTENRQDHIYQGIVRGKVHDERAYILDGVAGHAGLFSTSRDVSHFLQMILQEGTFEGKQIVSKQTLHRMFTPEVREANGISLDFNQRSLGWIVQGERSCAGDLASEETIMHTGFTGTHVVIDRKNKIAFSLLSNRVHPTRDNVKIIRYRALLGNYIFSHFK